MKSIHFRIGLWNKSFSFEFFFASMFYVVANNKKYILSKVSTLKNGIASMCLWMCPGVHLKIFKGERFEFFKKQPVPNCSSI